MPKLELSAVERELVYALIVYRIDECNDKIPMLLQGTQWEFIEDIIEDMHRDDYLEITEDSQSWRLASPKGKKLLAKMVAMRKATLKFEIFAAVSLSTEIDDEFMDSDTGEVNKDVWDDRYNAEVGEGHEDMRLAMIEHAAEKLRRAGKPQDLDTTRIIFIQNLANNEYEDDAKGFWHPVVFRELFDGIQEIKDNAYKWQDLMDFDAFEVGESVYAAGMIQLRKEEGASCPECEIPLAMYEADKPVDVCPGCEVNFGDPNAAPDDEGGGYECPKCKRDIKEGQDVCQGCGSDVDFSQPEGTVSTTTETHEETEIIEEYGYGGWYSPYDPMLDVMCFGLICGAILL